MEKTLLIIDSEERDRLTYSSHLQIDPRRDYQILEARTLEEGEALWRSNSPELVLLHVSDGGGLELLEVMQQDQAGAQLPVLALINPQDEPIALQALQLGAMDYLVKGEMTAFSFVHRINMLLERKAAAIALHNAHKTLAAKHAECLDLNQQLTQTREKLSIAQEELKERDLQLESKWLRYQDLFNFAPDGYIVTNTSGKIQEANQSALELLVTSGELIAYQPFSNFVDPLDLSEFHRHSAQLQQHPQEQSWEMRLKPQTGDSFPVEVTVIPHFDEVALESHCRWFIHNISDRKRTESALIESNLRFKTSFDNAAIGMSLSAIDGRLLAVNPAFCSIVGYSEAELLSLSFRDITAPEDLQVDLDYTEQLLRGEIRSFNLEKRYKHKNGQLIWVLLTLSLVRDEQEYGSYYIAQIQDIRDRKQAEAALKAINLELETRVEQRTAALKQSEARLQESQKVARLGSWEYDVSTGNITWSPELFHLYGLNPQLPEPTYEEHLQSFPSPDRERLKQAVNCAIEQGDSYAMDLQIIRADGSTGYVFAKGEPICNESGQVIRLFGIAMDISDRKQVEQELSHSRDLQEVIFNESTDALFLVDPQTMQTVDCNQRAVELFAAADKTELLQIEGHRLQRTPFSPEELAEILGQIRARRFWSRELEYFTLPGDPFWGNIVAKPIAIAGRRMNLVQVTDISYRKQAEAKLKASEERFQKIASTSPGMIYILVRPSQGVSYFEYTSSAVEEIHEVTIEQIRNQTHLLIEQIHPEDRASYGAAAIASLETLEIFRHEWRIITPSGKTKWLQATSRPERRPNGDVAWYGVVLDISDRKQTEMQLKATNEQLAISNAELLRATRHKDEFLSIMSHELRTPLNGILGMTVSLKEQKFGAIAAQQQDILDTIENSGNHLLNLINEILHLTEIETKQLRLHRTPTAIPALCQSSLSLIAPQASQKQIQLSLQLSPHLPEFLLDEPRIGQLLLNLLNNAVKFTPAGGAITLEVTCDLPPSPGTESSLLRIRVKDTGIGIAPQHLHKVFQPFFQSDRALGRQYGGIGLGLTLAKRIVESHEGSIALTSSLGVGSCFTVEFPAAPLIISPESIPASPTAFAPVASDPIQLLPLILLAENNEANRCSLSNYLLAQKKGYCFIFAKRGQEAIEIAQTRRPDLILLNIHLPDLTGQELIHQIRGDRSLAQIRIIAMGPATAQADRDRILAAGANDYISKPVNLKLLSTKIQHLLTPRNIIETENKLTPFENRPKAENEIYKIANRSITR